MSRTRRRSGRNSRATSAAARATTTSSRRSWQAPRRWQPSESEGSLHARLRLPSGLPLDEARRLGAEEGAAFLAGGQTLLRDLKHHRRTPTSLVKISGVLPREIDL